MIELSDHLPLRVYRLEARYSAVRLAAVPETRHLSSDFEEAAGKCAMLEEEAARLDVQRLEAEAVVEAADDAWDESVQRFHRHLIEAAQGQTEHPLYRKYFAEVPSRATSMSYAAEVLISTQLEKTLRDDEDESIQEFEEPIAQRRVALEEALKERIWLEVEEARFSNRVLMAKAILNGLRRSSFALVLEIARGRERAEEWANRFFRRHADEFPIPVEAETSTRSSLPHSEIRTRGGESSFSFRPSSIQGL